jgi:hypothetical protein
LPSPQPRLSSALHYHCPQCLQDHPLRLPCLFDKTCGHDSSPRPPLPAPVATINSPCAERPSTPHILLMTPPNQAQPRSSSEQAPPSPTAPCLRGSRPSLAPAKHPPFMPTRSSDQDAGASQGSTTRCGDGDDPPHAPTVTLAPPKAPFVVKLRPPPQRYWSSRRGATHTLCAALYQAWASLAHQSSARFFLHEEV